MNFRLDNWKSKENQEKYFKTTLGFGEYFGLPAVLSEELDHLGEPVEVSTKKFFDQLVKKEIWLLGASYNTTGKLESKSSMKCGEDSCYTKSLDNNKICKPGTLYFSTGTLKEKLSSLR